MDLVYQIVIGFIVGAILGPFSSGFVYLFLFTLLYEAWIFGKTRYYKEPYRYELRVVLTIVGVMGWAMARWAFYGECGLENLSGLPQRVYNAMTT